MSKYERKSETSRWVAKDGKILFKTETQISRYNRTFHDWLKDGETIVTFKEPAELGYKKAAEFYVVTFDTIPDQKTRGGKRKQYFKEKITATIRDSEPYMYIYLNDSTQSINGEVVKTNKFYLRELNRSITLPLPLISNEYVRVEKAEPEAITGEEAKALLEKYNYIFDAVEMQNDEEVYRQNVSRYIENPM